MPRRQALCFVCYCSLWRSYKHRIRYYYAIHIQFIIEQPEPSVRWKETSSFRVRLFFTIVRPLQWHRERNPIIFPNNQHWFYEFYLEINIREKVKTFMRSSIIKDNFTRRLWDVGVTSTFLSSFWKKEPFIDLFFLKKATWDSVL